MAPPKGAPGAAALDDLARCEARALRALAGRLARDPSEASDLVQDAYERALRRGRELPRGELRAWMATVIRNLFVDRCRRQRALQGALDLLRMDRATFCGEREELTADWSTLTCADVTSALEKLAAPFREVFELHARDMSLAQVAATLGIPVSTAGTRLFRARRKLRAELASVAAMRQPEP